MFKENKFLFYGLILYNYNVEITFAYNSFKWTNNAKGNAGVTVLLLV